MARILIVDDSREVQTVVSRSLAREGFEVLAADDGEQALTLLADGGYDLVILDVAMPVLDGPGMLARLRERGDHTPVLMLTSESKRSVIAGCIKLGIDGYILKPFKPDELWANVNKVLRPLTGPQPIRPGVDILIVDDMDNVHRKMRQLVPAELSIDSCTDAQPALQMARERVYRMILIDLDIPNIDSWVLGAQLRTLQPQAACLALALRHHRDGEEQAQRAGFDGILFKPFEQAQVEECLAKNLENEKLVTSDANLIAVARYTGREDRVDRYFRQIQCASSTMLETIAAASFERVIVDLSAAPVRLDRTCRLVAALREKSAQVGLELRLIGSDEIKTALAAAKDTNRVPVFGDLLAARAP